MTNLYLYQVRELCTFICIPYPYQMKIVWTMMNITNTLSTSEAISWDLYTPHLYNRKRTIAKKYL